MCLDDTFQAHGLRSSVRNCQHINSKGIFQSGLLIEHIGQILYVRTFLQVNDDTDSFFGRLIGNIHDVCCLLGLYQIADII